MKNREHFKEIYYVLVIKISWCLIQIMSSYMTMILNLERFLRISYQLP